MKNYTITVIYTVEATDLAAAEDIYIHDLGSADLVDHTITEEN